MRRSKKIHVVKPRDRFIPGHEAGGVVTAIGKGVTDLKVGDKVAVGK